MIAALVSVSLLALAGIARHTQLRRRARLLPTLTEAADAAVDGWHVVTAPGVQVDENTVHAAVAHATQARLRALDLVPSGVSPRAVVRQVNPATYRGNRAAAGYTAGHAVLVRGDLARRLGLNGACTALRDPAAMRRLAIRLKEYAPASVDLAVAPRLAGTGTVGRCTPDKPVVDRAALRRSYADAVSGGIERFFEPRRTDCPWCGSSTVDVEARVSDLYQGKPGRFTLERCRACGHVFQNPRLSLAGLEYYYRDFYDGLGADAAAVLARMYSSFRERAEMPRPFTTPRAWLDVGSGPGHFCEYARELWPDTVFDGLDMSSSVRDGERRGWLDTGHLGQFPDLANALAGSYDVVSMHHYLEHTREPRAELAAAATVLPPGGHLLIEVPDPTSPLRRLFGSRWTCWFQPQHQHFVPPANLRKALAEHGFTVVCEQNTHTGSEFVGAVAGALMTLAPDPRRPWSTRAPTFVRRAWHHTALVLSVPFFIVAIVLEIATAAITRRLGGGNAYRVLARREGD